jgi:hypothetical protein
MQPLRSDVFGSSERFLIRRLRNLIDRSAGSFINERVNRKESKLMDTIVPLISSGVAGPLGVLHLPRLWLKASLDARGKLAAGYPAAGSGYDQMVLTALNLDRQKTLDYIKSSRPTYSQFENWVKQQPGVKLDKGSVDKINGDIRGYNHDDATRKCIFDATGYNDQSCAFRGAIELNNLEDWNEFHSAVLK